MNNDLDLHLDLDLDLDLDYKNLNKIKIICILLNNNCVENIIKKKIVCNSSFFDQNSIFKFLTKLFSNSKKLVNYNINDYNIKYVLNYNLNLDVDTINDLDEDFILDDYYSSMYLLKNYDFSLSSLDQIQNNFDITDSLLVFLNKKYKQCYIRNSNVKNSSKKYTKKVKSKK
jgi:hypothetical protein